jgi:hypothetical protein
MALKLNPSLVINLKRKNTETYVLALKVVNFAKNTVYYDANPAAPIIQRQSDIWFWL